MAIDKDKVHKTAIEIAYTRTGNTLHARTRNAVKDFSGQIFITFDETVDYVGKAALAYLDNAKAARDSSQAGLDAITASNNAVEQSMQEDIDFIQEQIDEIEALL